MTAILVFIAISAVLIGIITYSALVVSSKQEQRMIQRVKTDKEIDQHHYSSGELFAFETSKELGPEEDDDFNDFDVFEGF